MSREARAIIRWIPRERGGRTKPPMPPAGYTSVVQFEADPQYQRGAWSLRIVSATLLRDDQVISATIRFVFPEAPHEMLAEGERFELLEGRQVVAKGVVLPTKVNVPDQIGEFEMALLG